MAVNCAKNVFQRSSEKILMSLSGQQLKMSIVLLAFSQSKR